MRQKKKHSHVRLKIAIVVVLAFIWLIAGLFRYVNSPKLQSMIFASVNKVSSLKIQAARLNLRILKRDVTITNVALFNPQKGQSIKADKIFFRFKIVPLFKAGLKLRYLKIDNIHIDVAKKKDEPKKKRPKISLTNLLLLRNLTIKNGIINNISITTPKSLIEAKQATIEFTPSIWGDIDLSLKILFPEVTPKGKPELAAEEVTVKGSTNVSKWLDEFPYVDNIKGNIGIKEFRWKDMEFETIDADLSYSGKKIEIEGLNASIQGDKIEIEGKVNGNNEKYSLKIDIPEPIDLPHLARDTSFIDTSGRFGGKIFIEGKGLDYKTTNALADVDINHKLGGYDALPAELKSRLDISGGQINTNKAELKVGDNLVSVSGSFNYVKPNIDLSFEGDNIPVETVLNRFQSRHYHPTTGMAKVSGRLSGWKPNIKFNLVVDANNVSYYDIVADHVKMDLDLTYHQLNLTGIIYQGDHEAGTVNLAMKMGKKLADGTRHKTFDLNAKLDKYDLDPSMTAYNLMGEGNGHITLQGTPKSYSGSGKASITNGSLKGISFLSARSDIKFSTKKLVFNNIVIATSETNPAAFSSPMVMDVADYGVRLHGSPRDGFTIDSRYLSASSRWQIDKLTYSSPEHPEWESKLSGTIGKEGELSLKVSGMFDTSLLTHLRGLVRDTKGPAELKNIHIGGTSTNTSLTGNVVLNNNSIQLRDWGYNFNKINGTIVFKGHTITTSDLAGMIEYGDFSLNGSVNHQNNEINHTNLKFIGKSIFYATPDRTFRMEFDCDLDFKGGPTSSLLSGDIHILDGRYTKSFSIFEKMKKGMAYHDVAPVEAGWKNIRLDLKIKTAGDLKIDNNIGQIWLNADLTATGFKRRPNITGNIETVGGEIHYAGLDFEVTRGYVEFRAPYTDPFLEFVASKEVGNYNISLTVKGRTDKLYVDLQSTPPLEQRDILALLTFGSTEEDIQKARFGYQIGTGLVAEQIGTFLQRPVTKFTPLDRFRIEAAPRTRGGEVTRLYMGKDISDRLKINFITDVSTEDAQQTFEAEYLLTDFMILKGARMSNTRYRFHLSFRFREQ